MHPFEYHSASTIEQAAKLNKDNKAVAFIAGGTTLLDLMKLNIEKPEHLVDLNKLDLHNIEVSDNSIIIGALVSNSALAFHKEVQKRFPVLSEAILAGASAQLRNMATVGGNILQKTRCYYFRDNAFPCNKRVPGSGCPAIDGYNRMHAILGGSESCVATHGSDMCVALVVLGAKLHISGPSGKRVMPLEDFYLLPGSSPDKENLLEPGEIITSVEINDKPFSQNSHYLKLRDRASYAFSLSSVAVAIQIENDVIKDCRLGLGGVATKPWRCTKAEKSLIGQKASTELFKKCAELALEDAKGLKHNSFKIELSKRTIVRALNKVRSEA